MRIQNKHGRNHTHLLDRAEEEKKNRSAFDVHSLEPMDDGIWSIKTTHTHTCARETTSVMFRQSQIANGIR